MRRLLLIGALLTGSALSQTAQTPTLRSDNPYTALVRQAKQVVVHIPTLADGNLVNALKVARNLNVPMRVITTDNGLMQENGLVLTLIVLEVPVYQVPSGGERRVFMEVESAAGWAAYDLSQGRPIQRSVTSYAAFNRWYGVNADKLPRYVPQAAVAAWTKAYLGYTLKAGGITFDTTSPPEPLRPPPSR